MKLNNLIIIFLILLSFFLYSYIAENPREVNSSFIVTRVLDGDTIEIETGQKIRLLGINTPEKGMHYYEDAMNFLSSNILNKTILIESYGTDRYGRILAHIFKDKTHLNKELISLGFAHLYYYDLDNYYRDLKDAEENARTKEIGIWKKSKNYGCLRMVEFEYIEKTARCSNEEILTLENSCDYDLDIWIKDDATHIYKETILSNSILSKNFSCIWNDDGDTIYISDSEGLLIFYRY